MTRKNANITGVDKKSPISTLKIDLLSKDRGAINIGEEWTIQIEKPKSNLLRRVFDLSVGVEKKVQLTLRDIHVDNNIVADKKRLFSMRINSKKHCMDGTNSLLVTLSELSTSFYVFLETSQIIDCLEPMQATDKQYPINFTVAIQNPETGEDIHVSKESVSISFNSVQAIPDIKIFIDEKYKEIKYNKRLGAAETIGYIEINNNSPLVYFPNIDMKLRFGWILAEHETLTIPQDAVSLDFSRCNVQFSSTSRFEAGFTNIGSTKLGNSKSIRVPIIANFKQIGNSYQFPSREFFMTAEVEYCHHNTKSSNFTKQSAQWTEIGNTQLAELHVFVKDGSNNCELFDNKPITLSKRTFLFTPTAAAIREEIALSLTNSAKSGLPHAGIVIGDFNYDNIEFIPDTTIATYSSRRLNEKNVFKFSDPHGSNEYSQLAEGRLSLYSQPDSKMDILFGFSNNDIRDIHAIVKKKKDYNVSVKVTFSFNYWLNDAGDREEVVTRSTANRFTGIFIIPLYQKPNAEWLGIDFGTSAIVSLYEGNILDLHSQKRLLFNVPDGDRGMEMDNYEQGTPFLSSNIVFRTNAKVDPSLPRTQLLTQSESVLDYNSLAVCLSPTSSQEKKDIRGLLPCLKMLMGYEFIPGLQEMNRHINYYTIREENSQPVKTALLEEEEGELIPTELAHVDKVFEEIYKQMFVYYISNCLPKEVSKSQINRIVLTVPNTFTPRHISKLNDIVRSSLKEMNIRDISFVSESDAVACFYQKNRGLYNRNIRRSLESISQQETILVYDMGAGTLDLTLLRRTSTGNNVSMEVLGKIGISKAGNYLDYVIATLIVKKSDRLKNLISNISSNAHANSAQALKNFIKNKVKPQLSALEKGQLILNAQEDANFQGIIREDIIIDIQEDILNTPEFKNYINDCTERIISNFFKFLNFNDKIDTLIISGRSSKLKQIQMRLSQVMNKWKSENYAVIDTSTGKSDKSKTSVIEGAMAYADWINDAQPTVVFKGANIVACFGIIYQDIDGNDLYKELFNPRKESPVEELDYNGTRVKTYNTEDIVVDLSNTDKLQLIQTYSANPKKEWAKEEHDEYISTVATYNCKGFANRQSAKLHIEVDRENTLRLFVNDSASEGFAPNKIELGNSTISKSLWPMFNSNN